MKEENKKKKRKVIQENTHVIAREPTRRMNQGLKRRIIYRGGWERRDRRGRGAGLQGCYGAAAPF